MSCGFGRGGVGRCLLLFLHLKGMYAMRPAFMVHPTHTIAIEHDDGRPNATNGSQLHCIILWKKAKQLYAFGHKSILAWLKLFSFQLGLLDFLSFSSRLK